MGSELYRMVRDGAPPEWTLAMRMVAWVIADDARDPSQGLPEDGGWPWSVIEMSRYRDSKGEWRDGLTERAGLSAHTVRHALAGLGKAGYEMREQVTDRDGKPVFDRLGRPVFAYHTHAVRYCVPPLKPRESPTDSVDLTAAEGPPNRVTKGRAKVRRSGHEGPLNQSRRSADSADPISPGLPIVSPASQSSVVNSNLEGGRDRQGDDDSTAHLNDSPGPPAARLRADLRDLVRGFDDGHRLADAEVESIVTLAMTDPRFRDDPFASIYDVIIDWLDRNPAEDPPW